MAPKLPILLASPQLLSSTSENVTPAWPGPLFVPRASLPRALPGAAAAARWAPAARSPNKRKKQDGNPAKRRLFGFGPRETRTSGKVGAEILKNAACSAFGTPGEPATGPETRTNGKTGQSILPRRRLFGLRRDETRTNVVLAQTMAEIYTCSGRSVATGVTFSLNDDSKLAAADKIGH